MNKMKKVTARLAWLWLLLNHRPVNGVVNPIYRRNRTKKRRDRDYKPDSLGFCDSVD